MEPNHESPAEDEGNPQNHAQPDADQENAQNIAVPDAMIFRSLSRVTDNNVISHGLAGPGIEGLEMIASSSANQLTMREELYGRGRENDNDDPELARRRILVIRVPMAWFNYLTEEGESGNEQNESEREVRDAIADAIADFRNDRITYHLPAFRVAPLLLDLPRITPAEIQQFNRDAGANGPEIASYCVMPLVPRRIQFSSCGCFRFRPSSYTLCGQLEA